MLARERSAPRQAGIHIATSGALPEIGVSAGMTHTVLQCVA